MPDVDVLRELSGQFQRPAFDDLVAVSAQRRRRKVVGAATGAAVVVLAVALAGGALSDRQRTVGPSDPPPSESPSTSAEWTPERFRDEGTSDVLIPKTESGLSVTQYLACSGTCSGELSNRALEVSQDGQSALFEVRGLLLSFVPAWVKVYDEDSVLVQDAVEEGRPEGPVRFRLLRADGTAVELDAVDDPAPAVPGPDLVVVDSYASWHRGSGPNDPPRLRLVDDEAATVRPVNAPVEIVAWGPNVDEFLWGANGCRAIWQQPDGSFDFHDVDCADPVMTRVPSDYWDYLDGWAEPGRLLLLEHDTDGVPLALHVSVDYGATWTRVEIEERPWDGTIAQVGAALAFALGEVE